MLNSGLMTTKASFRVKVEAGHENDAYDRSAFAKTTVHVPGGTITVQVSNVLVPTAETDWVDITDGTVSDSMVYVNMPVTWIRVGGVTAGQTICIQSNQYHF